MRTPVLLLVLFIGLCGAVVPMDRNVLQNQTEDSTLTERKCSDPICDPDRYVKLNAGLIGYNIFKGEPYFLSGDTDPGNRNQIFNNAVEMKNGRMKLDGVTYYPDTSCQSKLHSKVITTAKEYRDRMLETVTEDRSLGYKQEANIEVAKGPATLSTTVENSVSLAFSESKSMNDITEYLSNGHKAMTISDISCVSDRLQIDMYSMPQFTAGFTKALITLNGANEKSEDEKRTQFKSFVEAYGTHFMKEVKLGAKLTYTTKFTSKARKNFNSNNLDKCSKSSFGLKFFGIHANEDKSKCSEKSSKQVEQNKKIVEDILTKTRGSTLPDNIKTWSQQEFNPVPISMKLRPIADLLTDHNLEHQNALKGKINGAALREWFTPMQSQYCTVLGLDCLIHTGCGYTDTCNFNQFCDKENGVSKCTDIPVEFTAWAEPKGEQFMVYWTIPLERFDDKLIFSVKYRSNGGWVDGVKSTKAKQFMTKMPTSETDHGGYVFQVKAIDEKKVLQFTAETEKVKRELTRSALGGSCTSDKDCITEHTECSSNGKCQCGTGYEQELYPYPSLKCIQSSACCYTREAWDYKGTQAIAENGKACLNWDAVPDRSHYVPFTESNYCREPTKQTYPPTTSNKPWCYTFIGNSRDLSDVTHSYCNIPSCTNTAGEIRNCKTAECCYTGLGENYQGTQSVAENGYACLTWKYLPNNNEYKQYGVKNYCRNPAKKVDPSDTTSRPWCYILKNPETIVRDLKAHPLISIIAGASYVTKVLMKSVKYGESGVTEHIPNLSKYAVTPFTWSYCSVPRCANKPGEIKDCKREEQTLEGSDTSEPEGDWGRSQRCDLNEYVYGYQMRSYQDLGGGSSLDDVALTNLRLFCRRYGTVEKSSTLDSSNGITADNWGTWKKTAECSGTEQVTGFQIRIYKPESTDRVGATDVRLFCKSGSTIVAGAFAGSRVWGTWSEAYRCPEGYAVAGFNTKVQPSAGSENRDDVGLNGVKMICSKYV